MSDYEPIYPKTKAEFILDISRILQERDFVEFCKYLKIVPKEGSPFRFSFDRWFPAQKQFQHTRTKRDVILKSRQIGFSTLEFARDLFYALCFPESTVAIITTDEELSKSFLRIVKDFYDSLVEWGFPELNPNKDRSVLNQATQIRLSNGSYIKAISAGATEHKADKAARGTKINRLHASECAFWKEAEATMRAAFQSVPNSDDCEVVIESTPNGFGSWFYNFVVGAQSEDNGYKLHFFPWHEHPEHIAKRIPDKPFEPQNAFEKRLVSSGLPPQRLWFFRFKTEEVGLNSALAEYPSDPYSCFVSSGDAFLTPEEHQYLASCVIDPMRVDTFDGYSMRVYEDPLASARYIVSIDPAGGGGGDNSVILVLNRDSMQIAAIFATNQLRPKAIGKIAVRICRIYNDALCVPESNHSDLCLETIESEYSNLFSIPNYVRKGWLTNAHTRPKMIEALKEAIADKVIRWIDPDLFRELTELQLVNGRIQAPNKNSTGKNAGKDDRAIAYAIALAARSHGSQPLTHNPYLTGQASNRPNRREIW